MNKEVKKAIKTLKTFLGMETKLEDMPLADGMTTIQADMFEVGESVFIVVENADPVPLPVGEYELADGRILVVEVEGIIAAINEVATEEEVEVEPTEVPVEAEKVAPQTTTAKKIIRSTVEEQHFSKLEAKIEELEAKILELSKVETVVETVVELEEVKPIKFNPENKTKNNTPLTPLERYRDIKSRMNG
jgi:hypothetical protein